MQRKLSNEDRTIRAERARQLLDDTVFKDALAKVEADAYEQLLVATDDATRKELIHRINATRALTTQIRSYIVDGIQAERVKPGIA